MEPVISSTKETKEALKAVIALAAFISERMKDGVGFDDALALFSKLTADDVFKKKLKEGYEGIDKVGEELKNLDVQGMTSLALDIAPDIIDLLAKLKK